MDLLDRALIITTSAYLPDEMRGGRCGIEAKGCGDDGNFSVYDPNHNNRSSSRNPIPTPAPVPSESAIVPPPATTGVYPFVVDHQLPAAGEVVKSDQLTPGVATTNAMDTT
ncbi:hypothetical protein PSHT_05739 [Puccinia striiformis]|uniref:Uncharacterized protein n=1 Tax=Puccinia striiformis TaxID=27350 RepID=A0A2S4W9W6_9BASI|nr:hypothetical protein PSHT_05739 [Puccinia striiformis]